ncbi:MAG: peptidylprolyl isomerase [Myxococcota bacterium]
MLRPLVHFLAIGALLFALDAVRGALQDVDAGAPIERVEVTPDVVERIERDAIAETGRRPSERELAARVDAWVDDEVLHREAVRLGLDRIDPVVRARLVRNMRFLAGEDDPRTDEELYAEALAVGMDRSDIVVRRRLVQQMRFLLEGAAPAAAPSDDELRAYVASRPERYRIPPRVRLTHVYLSRDRRGDALEADARALRARLERDAVPPDAARGLGDPFLHPTDLGLQTEAQLAKQLGPDFARAALALAPGGWQGPVESAYGMHLVWVRERRDAEDPDLESVRRSALSALQAERDAEAFEAGLARLRARYVDAKGASAPRAGDARHASEAARAASDAS